MGKCLTASPPPVTGRNIKNKNVRSKTKKVIGHFDKEPISEGYEKAVNRNRKGLKKKLTAAEKYFATQVARIISDEARTPFMEQRIFYISDLVAFVADVYFKKFSLAVEIDGGSHNSRRSREYDAWRSKLLYDHAGVTIIRFSNKEVLNDPIAVFGKVVRALGEQANATPSHRAYLRKVYAHYFA